jgi:hypothetical protein
MHRVIMFAAAALLIAIAGRTAAADDHSVCGGIGTLDELIAAFSSVLARNPAEVGAYSNRGEYYGRKGDVRSMMSSLAGGSAQQGEWHYVQRTELNAL